MNQLVWCGLVAALFVSFVSDLLFHGRFWQPSDATSEVKILLASLEPKVDPETSTSATVPRNVNVTKLQTSNYSSSIESSKQVQPLEFYIDETENTIHQNLETLLNFAVLGHPMSVIEDIRKHPEIDMPKRDTSIRPKTAAVDIVKSIHSLNPDKVRGYQNPKHIFVPSALEAIQNYFPSTKLIIGLQHPVTFFESFYNNRLQNNATLPAVEDLLGKCFAATKQVCVERARYHYNLVLLGKTPFNDDEKRLFRHGEPLSSSLHLRNPVFLYEANQVNSSKFAQDLQQFLRLGRPFEQLQVSTSEERMAGFNICEPRYTFLRNVLLQAGKESSEWIRQYLLSASDVHVSSRDEFIRLLRQWEVDPCDEDHGDANDLSTLVDFKQSEVIGDVQPLLDFAHIGFAKCASSSFVRWMNQHPQAAVIKDETKAREDIPDMVQHLFNLTQGSKRGFKNPTWALHRFRLIQLQNYFPETKLVVGVRHPVTWFESFYNHALREGRKFGFRMPPAEELTDTCKKGVCVKGSRFHYYISQLGKTSMDSEEMQLFRHGTYENFDLLLPNDVFIYVSDQFDDVNETVRENLRLDMQHYLNLSSPLPQLVLGARENATKQFNICESKYYGLRRDLVEIGADASKWILDYFIKARGVYVSSVDNFAEHLRQWAIDPCSA